MLKKTKGNYIVNDEGKIVAWVRTKEDQIDDELQLLRYEIEKLKQEKEEKEAQTIGNSAAEVRAEVKVNTDDIRRAGDQIKKELDRILKF